MFQKVTIIFIIRSTFTACLVPSVAAEALFDATNYSQAMRADLGVNVTAAKTPRLDTHLSLSFLFTRNGSDSNKWITEQLQNIPTKNIFKKSLSAEFRYHLRETTFIWTSSPRTKDVRISFPTAVTHFGTDRLTFHYSFVRVNTLTGTVLGRNMWSSIPARSREYVCF